MDTHITPHKIKAEWTRSSTHEAHGESHNKFLKNDKNGQDIKHGKVKILEQIVLRPSNEESQLLAANSQQKQDKVKVRKNSNRKAEESKSKKCQICEKSFLTDFEEHVKSHVFFECTEPDCHKKFKRKSSLRKHMYVHKGKFKYSCEDCNETFIDKCKYQIHVASKHKKIDRVYECKECDKTFTSADYLRKHQITHKDEFPYPCSMCNQKFKWLTSLQAHNLIHTQNKTAVQCKNCSKRFFNQRTLDRHMKIHQNIKYHCKICNSVVSTRKDNIMRHIRHLHNDIPRAEFSNHIGMDDNQKTVKSDIIQHAVVNQEENVDEIEITDDDDDDSNDLIIDESIQEEPEIVETQQHAIINNRVNVIQSIGNPNKNQQQSPQNVTVTATTTLSNSENTIINHNAVETEKTLTTELITINDNKSNQIQTNQLSEKIDTGIRLPPKKKYNPIEHYRKILGLSETNTSATSEIEQSPEQVFPDHWRKRTSQNFLFRR